MLILKSASPRRQQILKDLKLKFLAEPSHINEDARKRILDIQKEFKKMRDRLKRL